jgi:hypothetical protein
MGLDNELREAQEVFRPIKECVWLSWAGDALMVKFAKEVEAEQKAEEEEQQRVVEEDTRQKQEEEEERWQEEVQE